jgi:hypothetical protein
MAGILERNFMKVWFAAAGVIGYHIATDARALAISRQDEKEGQLTIIYRRPFCPIGRVERYHTPDKLGQSARDWELDMSDNYKIASDWQWVMPSPTGNHQIIYTHPTRGPLLGYYSRVFGVCVFPFKQI